ncbi:hypothetical protein [Candidatus Paracaedibacter symbiosus]|uniref:hypothetical protein n=1 Tax=Candidatus Paracaedibacter symbiosus TaxID=244582 RepID=UPI000509F369|nr:hypothetical protein [Candidatus Paracaedibacter symbiosus]
MKKRGPYVAVEARNTPFVERIYQLKSDHLFWGYRRILAHMTYVDGLKISKHRVELAPQTRTERDRYDLKFYKLYKR